MGPAFPLDMSFLPEVPKPVGEGKAGVRNSRFPWGRWHSPQLVLMWHKPVIFSFPLFQYVSIHVIRLK